MHPAFRRHSIHIPSPISYSTITKIIRTENTSTSTRPIYITIQTQSKQSNHHPTSSNQPPSPTHQSPSCSPQPHTTGRCCVLPCVKGRPSWAFPVIASTSSGKLLATMTYLGRPWQWWNMWRFSGWIQELTYLVKDMGMWDELNPRWSGHLHVWRHLQNFSFPSVQFILMKHTFQASLITKCQWRSFFWPIWMLFRTGLL